MFYNRFFTFRMSLYTTDSRHGCIKVHSQADKEYENDMKQIIESEPQISVDAEGISLSAEGQLTLLQVLDEKETCFSLERHHFKLFQCRNAICQSK